MHWSATYYGYSEEELLYERKKLFCDMINKRFKLEKCYKCYCVGNKYNNILTRIKILGKRTENKYCKRCREELRDWQRKPTTAMIQMMINDNLKKKFNMNKKISEINKAMLILK